MSKKTYISPTTEMMRIHTATIIAGSPFDPNKPFDPSKAEDDDSDNGTDLSRRLSIWDDED